MYIDTDTQETLTRAELRRRFPRTSWPAEPNEAALAVRGLARVRVLDRPEHDPATQRLEPAAPELVEGEWVRGWTVIDVPPPTTLTYVRFRARFHPDNELPALQSAVTQDAQALDWALEAAADNVVNLDSATTAAFLQKAVDAGVITEARKAEIEDPAWSPPWG